MNKKFIGALVGAGLLLATAIPAFAADCTIDSTGPFSGKNSCRIKNNKTVNYKPVNVATVKKTQIGVSNSGLNSQLLNTNLTGGGITTKNAASTVDSLTDVNSGEVAVDQSAGGSSSGSISNTGPFSENVINIKANKKADITVTNIANVEETNVSVANSGGNSISLNTNASGTINAGSATSDVKSTTYVNYTKVSIEQ